MVICFQSVKNSKWDSLEELVVRRAKMPLNVLISNLNKTYLVFDPSGTDKISTDHELRLFLLPLKYQPVKCLEIDMIKTLRIVEDKKKFIKNQRGLRCFYSQINLVPLLTILRKRHFNYDISFYLPTLIEIS